MNDNSAYYVTLRGECFQIVLQGKVDPVNRDGLLYKFHLTDLKKSRGKRLVAVFATGSVETVSQGRIEAACINAIRRAFDTGTLSFDHPPDERYYKEIPLSASDFENQETRTDAEIRQYIVQKAYWLAYRFPMQPHAEGIVYPIPFDEPADLDYLGTSSAEVRRNIRRMANQGLLEKVLEGHARPTERLLSEFESAERSTPSDPVKRNAAAATSSATEDHKFARLAIEEARKSVPEDDRVHPKVGVVVVKDGRILATAHRGEFPQCHAEYVAMEKKLADASLAGSTVYTTLEPCTSRNHPKVPCATRLAERKVARVVIGMLDPDERISGRGQRALRKAGIATELFDHDLMTDIEELNRDFIREREQRILTSDEQNGSRVPIPTENTAGRQPIHLKSTPKIAMPKEDLLFDVFVSHATEDKAYVEPLVKALEAAGIRVWYDKLTLEWGDDLRSAIDRGLSNCRYGIVVFSKSFLAKKKWTEYELNSLFALEQPGKKIILPIWHGITRDDLLQYGAGFADRLAKISSKDSYDDIVESLLGLLGRSKPQKSGATGGAASVRSEPDQKQDVREITLEAFYINHGPDRQAFACQSVSVIPGRYVDHTSADGKIMRSEIEPPAVLVKGVDVNAIETLGWEPTGLRFKDAKTGEEKVFSGQLRDTVEPDALKFAIHGGDAKSGTKPMPQTPLVAEAVKAKPNAIAYAWYETKGENATKAKAFIRPSAQQDGWFTFENSFGEEIHGTKEEIALRFAAFDRSLSLKHYVRMQHTTSDPAFNLG
jgi:pyrimidine deaminase RibD-like protein